MEIFVTKQDISKLLGQTIYVIGPRRSGRSSIMSKIIEKLGKQNITGILISDCLDCIFEKDGHYKYISSMFRYNSHNVGDLFEGIEKRMDSIREKYLIVIDTVSNPVTVLNQMDSLLNKYADYFTLLVSFDDLTYKNRLEEYHPAFDDVKKEINKKYPFEKPVTNLIVSCASVEYLYLQLVGKFFDQCPKGMGQIWHTFKDQKVFMSIHDNKLEWLD